ncbi:hypothetical protein EYR41_004211 [Orbilia oligospora]|uniref:Uncharacterized protein n=1 Tax=Orbilia oligospora TaxID=2813651 RepID=A0A8H2E7F0_ORBOL|nr:hypothetical protein EYR41_004211 [Orbilia oligospora]
MPSDCSPSSFSDADSDSDPNADAVDADSDSDADSAPDSSELVRAHASPRYKHFPTGHKEDIMPQTARDPEPEWIQRGNQNYLWLLPKYRSIHLGIAHMQGVITIGRYNGRISLLGFKDI